MPTQLQKSLGVIRSTNTDRGRGVFAIKKISAGQIVEICPVIKIDVSTYKLPRELQLVVFHWEALAGTKDIRAVALGYGGMYNHANPANTVYSSSEDAECLVFKANKDIDAGEEITINYNDTLGQPISTEDVWFKNTGIKPIP